MHRRALRATLTALPLTITLGIAACVGSDDAASAESDHQRGAPTFASHAWLWSDESEEDFKERMFVQSFLFFGGVDFLSTHHPLTERLQLWIDRFDEALRAAHPDALRATPKPRIVVMKNSMPNAWVTPVPVAWKVPTRFASSEDSASSIAEAGTPEPSSASADAGDAGAPPPPRFAHLQRTGTVTTLWATPLERPYDERDLDEFARFYDEGFTHCRIAHREGSILLGARCAERPDDTQSFEADGIAFEATSRWITITTGFVKWLLDENRIVAILAHELGHYYRAHASQSTDILNYFYALGDGNTDGKPAPDPRYLEQTATMREKLRDPFYAEFNDENLLMVERRLGFYTVEQEADELGLELLAMIGQPPSLMADALLRSSDHPQQQLGRDPSEIDWAKCSLLRERGFKDEHGAWLSVPVGDPADAHHSACFRAFNLTREIAVHRYELAAPPPPFATSWWDVLRSIDNPGPSSFDGGAPDGGEARDGGETPNGGALDAGL